MSSPAPQQGETYTQSPYEVGQRTIKEIIADLSKPIPRRLLSSKTVGGQEILYIPWHTAVKMLDYRAPGWTWDITHLTHLSGRVGMVGRLTIPASDGHPTEPTVQYYFRDASGTEGDDQDKYGDPVSNAESMCFRRAASKFGLGLHLYGGQRPQQSGGSTQRAPASQGQRPTPPQAGGSGAPSANQPGSVTPKQLGMIRAIAAEKGLDHDTESVTIHGVETPDLTIKQASELIKHLQEAPAF